MSLCGGQERESSDTHPAVPVLMDRAGTAHRELWMVVPRLGPALVILELSAFTKSRFPQEKAFSTSLFLELQLCSPPEPFTK